MWSGLDSILEWAKLIGTGIVQVLESCWPADITPYHKHEFPEPAESLLSICCSTYVSESSHTPCKNYNAHWGTYVLLKVFLTSSWKTLGEWITLAPDVFDLVCQMLCECQYHWLSLLQASSPAQTLLRDYCRVNYGGCVINRVTLRSANLSSVAVLGVWPWQSPHRNQNNSGTV